MKMLARTIAVFLVLLLACGMSADSSADEAAQGLVLEKVFPLKNVTGRIDHMAVDLAQQRLAIAELGNNSVDILDLSNGRVAHRITGLQEPQGIAWSADLLAVANAGDGSVRFFRAHGFTPAGRLDLGDDADNIRVDKSTGRLIVGYGEGGLAIVDPANRSKLMDVALAAHPEGFQLSPDGSHAFVNVPDARRIVSVDLVSGKHSDSWDQPNLRSNFPMAIDSSGGTLAIAFRGPPRLVLLRAGTGKVTASVDTCSDADDVFFDSRRRRIYVSCGAGAVDVFDRSDDLRRIAQVKTYPGARTALFVPELDRLFVASPSSPSASDARVLEFRPTP